MRFSWTVKRLERRRTLGQSNGVVSSVAPPGGGSAGVERARRGRRKRARQQRATRLTRWHRARDGRHTDGARAARPATAGPPVGGGHGGRPAPPRGRTTGRHVRAGCVPQISPRLYLPPRGTCLALYLAVLVGWRCGLVSIRGIGPARRVTPLLGRRATTVGGTVVAGKETVHFVLYLWRPFFPDRVIL